MNATPNQSYQELLSSTHFDELRDRIQVIVKQLGFDGFLYLTLLGKAEPGVDPETFVLSSYHPDFVQQYQSRHCYRMDPAANYIRQYQLPTPWGLHDFTGPQAEAMYRTATKYGVCSGATFPVTPPMVTVAGFGYATAKPYEQALPAILASMPHGQLLAVHVHQAITRLLNLFESPEAHTITPREKACLTLAAQGLRDGEIADMLGIATRTVLFHLGNARRKLQADNRAQMIARAMALKVIGI
jgi:LuxR family quorum-sensing transcriptional regulator LasR